MTHVVVWVWRDAHHGWPAEGPDAGWLHRSGLMRRVEVKVYQ
jgi:hypothetical protein